MSHSTLALDSRRTDEIVFAFHRDGYALVRAVLSQAEVDALRQRTDELLAEPRLAGTEFMTPVLTSMVLRYTFLLDRMFADLLVREPILSLVQAVLGPEVKCCGQNVIRGRKDEAINLWHVDDTVEFPLPEELPRFDARMRMPVLWLTVQIALTDIDSSANGPTEVVPTSHYSGRNPNDKDRPMFEGRGPTPILCKAGDAYLFNHQVWHRGSPNTSERTRYLLQSQYARRWAWARFADPVIARELPAAIFDGADEKVLKVLGRNAGPAGKKY